VIRMTVILTQQRTLQTTMLISITPSSHHYVLRSPVIAWLKMRHFFVSSVTIFVANISLHYVSFYKVATLCSCIRRNFTLRQNVVSREFSVFLCTVYSCVILSSIPVHLLSAILLVEETLHMFLELPLLSFLISTIISVLQPAQVPTRWFS